MPYISRIAFAMLALFVCSVPVQGALAAEQLGGKFISLCKSPNATSQSACGSVVTALMNAHVEMGRQNPDQRVICPPRRMSNEEGRRVFMQWTETTAGAERMAFPALVMTALLQRYPCTTYLKAPRSKARP